jgi:hypothetical protein
MKKILAVLVPVVLLGVLVGCDQQPASSVQSSSGVKKATVQISTNADGLTAEQQNIRDRLLEDNKQGSVKHLYVISAYSGQVIIYSTVRGKVTSGGKRLTPTEVAAIDGQAVSSQLTGIPVEIGGRTYKTSEVLQDDGTYGSSSEYLFWWDTKGMYHQHYVSGGQIVHVSNQPLAVKGIIINMEITQKPEE